MKLDLALPLPVHSVKSLLNHVLIDWTYNSNAIDENAGVYRKENVLIGDYVPSVKHNFQAIPNSI